MILQLLLRPTVTGVRIEQTDELVPSVFREALSVTVTVGYHRLARRNENPVLMWIPLGVLARWWYWLGHAGKMVGGGRIYVSTRLRQETAKIRDIWVHVVSSQAVFRQAGSSSSTA
ncbi:Hypothetical predicted protein [Olea europaea subsp. europaea]|uniref:Uncharacterized protein n=1 Tax=Olea europaea subsp. europaea TaxID=158383 RepID=A0A8S0VNE4_OLEEU|nr:Hypothetical predicted protein [Olea europaea subsp. europaea]